MKPEVTVRNNVETTHWATPAGMVEVDVYHPHSTPWEYYGEKHQRELSRVLKAAGIECTSFRTDRKIVFPQGTGPGGRVRFGDDMMPSIYRLAVAEKDKEAAEKAIEEHKKAIHAWLHEGQPMPTVCYE